MLAKTLFAAAAAASLLSTAAYAQRTYPPHVDMPLGAPQGTAQPSSAQTGVVPGIVVNPAPTASADATATAAPTAPASAEAPAARVEIITNGPVADTPENRTQFPPLSNAGRKTAPAGN